MCGNDIINEEQWTTVCATEAELLHGIFSSECLLAGKPCDNVGI